MAVHFFRLSSHHSRSVRRSEVVRGYQVSGVVPCYFRACAGGGLCCHVRWCSRAACRKQAQECNDTEVDNAMFQRCGFDCFHALNLRRTIRSLLSRMRQIFQCYSGDARHSLIRDSANSNDVNGSGSLGLPEAIAKRNSGGSPMSDASVWFDFRWREFFAFAARRYFFCEERLLFPLRR